MRGKPSATLQDIFIDAPPLLYEKNQVLIHAQDVPSGIFYIKSGVVKKTALLETGREITLRLYTEGSCFPLVWAFTDIDTYYYRTVTDVELQKVSRDKFVDFIKTHPEVLFDLTKQILLREYELFTNITHQLSGDSYHRVIAALVLCMQRFGVKEKKNDLIIRLPLTHQDIADIIGITRETVSLTMAKLKKKKIISTHNHMVVIKDVQALEGESTVNTEEEIPVQM